MTKHLMALSMSQWRNLRKPGLKLTVNYKTIPLVEENRRFAYRWRKTNKNWKKRFHYAKIVKFLTEKQQISAFSSISNLINFSLQKLDKFT